LIGGAEPVGSIAGSPVSSASAGGSVAAGPANGPAVSVSPAEAAGGLAGLGMGPLGGFGGQTGPASSSTVQVALNGPASPSLASNAFAVSLVTTTQVFSWSRGGEDEGEGAATKEAANPPVAEASDPPAAAADALTAVPADASAGPRGDPPADAPAPSVGSHPETGLAVSVDLSALTTPVAPTSAGDALSHRVDAGAVAAGTGRVPAAGSTPPGTGTWAAGWAIVAATLMAVCRARTAVRGLDWRKRTVGGAAQPAGPIVPRAPHLGSTINFRESGSTVMHGVGPRSRRGVQAACPQR
jgi:hypothetical protein